MVDSRDKPENDHKRSLIKGLDVVRQCAALLERRVQSSTRVRKAQAVTRQTNECIETAESGVDKEVSSCEKNPNILLENLDSVRECAGIFKRRVQKEYTSAKISSRHQLNEFTLGRSMIEMLGVLAIIGVLSVGGIAGYSKAMEKIKINKTLSTYNTLMFGFFQHIDDIRKIPDDDVSSPYAFSDLLVALELVPPSWRRGGKWLADDFGNRIRIYPNYIEILFENYTMSKSKQISFCREFFYTLAKGYHNELYGAYIWRQGKNTEIFYYGSKFCGNTLPCLRNMTYDDVNNQCQLCGKDSNKSCSLVLYY